jgi:hypothetical protein
MKALLPSCQMYIHVGMYKQQTHSSSYIQRRDNLRHWVANIVLRRLQHQWQPVPRAWHASRVRKVRRVVVRCSEVLGVRQVCRIEGQVGGRGWSRYDRASSVYSMFHVPTVKQVKQSFRSINGEHIVACPLKDGIFNQKRRPLLGCETVNTTSASNSYERNNSGIVGSGSDWPIDRDNSTQVKSRREACI